MALPAPFDNPLALGALTVAILAIVQYVRTLSYREVVGAQWAATKLFPVLDPLAKKRLSRPLTREKWMPEKDPDYLATLTFSARAVAGKLRSDGFDPQLLSTAKYRVRNGRRRRAVDRRGLSVVGGGGKPHGRDAEGRSGQRDHEQQLTRVSRRRGPC